MNLSTKEDMISLVVPPGKNVRPARVVKLAWEVNFGCEEAGGSSQYPFGISQEWVDGAPNTPYDDGYTSRTAKPTILVYGPTSVCKAAIKSNAEAMQPGASVGSNSDSELTVLTSGYAVGWLLEAGTADKSQRLRVYVLPHVAGAGSGS